MSNRQQYLTVASECAILIEGGEIDRAVYIACQDLEHYAGMTVILTLNEIQDEFGRVPRSLVELRNNVVHDLNIHARKVLSPADFKKFRTVFPGGVPWL